MSKAVIIGWTVELMGMTLMAYGYLATGNPSLIDWHASTPWWIADFLPNIESEVGMVLVCVGMVPILASGRQSGNHRRRKVRRILAQKPRQCGLEIARRDTAQVENRQKRIQAPRPPCPKRQNGQGEPNPLAVAGRPTIANRHPIDVDGTNSRLDRPGRPTTMTQL